MGRVVFLRILLIVALLLPFSGKAQAQTIDAAGAAHLKQLFTDILEQQKRSGQAFGGVDYTYEGEVMVEAAGAYYAVTLPYIRAAYPNGNMFDMGIVSVNATPHDGAKQWKMTLAIPTPMTFKKPDGTPSFTLAIGKQHFAGLYDEDLGYFFNLDARLENITGHETTEDVSLTIPKLVMTMDMKKDSAGMWSGPGTITLAGTTITGKKDSLALDEFKADFSIDRFNPAVSKTYQEQLNALLENEAAAVASASGKTYTPPSPENSLAFFNMFHEFIMKSANAYDSTYRIAGFSLKKVSPEDGAATSTKLDKAALHFGIKGFLEKGVSMALGGSFSGFSTNAVSAAEQDVIPDGGALEFSVINVPLKEMMELGKSTMEITAKDPNMAGLGWMQFLMKGPAFLSQAGTQAELRNGFVSGKDYRLNFSAQAKADIMAVNSATATGKASFSGLDGLIPKVEALSATSADWAEPLANLKTFKQNAQEISGINGMIHMIDLVMNKEGQILLNGKPWAPVPVEAEPVKPE